MTLLYALDLALSLTEMALNVYGPIGILLWKIEENTPISVAIIKSINW